MPQLAAGPRRLAVEVDVRAWDGQQEAIYNDFWTTAYQAIAD